MEKSCENVSCTWKLNAIVFKITFQLGENQGLQQSLQKSMTGVLEKFM